MKAMTFLQILLYKYLLRRHRLILIEAAKYYLLTEPNCQGSIRDFRAFIREQKRHLRKRVVWRNQFNQHFLGYATTYAAYRGTSVEMIEVMEEEGVPVDLDTLCAHAVKLRPDIDTSNIGAMIDALPASRLKTHYEGQMLATYTPSGQITGAARRL